MQNRVTMFRAALMRLADRLSLDGRNRDGSLDYPHLCSHHAGGRTRLGSRLDGLNRDGLSLDGSLDHSHLCSLGADGHSAYENRSAADRLRWGQIARRRRYS